MGGLAVDGLVVTVGGCVGCGWIVFFVVFVFIFVFLWW